MNDTTSGADLAAKKLPELQAMAAERGIKGARRLRKGELIKALRGGAVPASTAKSAESASERTSILWAKCLASCWTYFAAFGVG